MEPRQIGTSMQRDLVIGASTGDHEAFASLATDAYGRLHRIARLILRREDLASDAVQEALTSAWLHIRAVRDPDRFDAWLNRLLVHAVNDEFRRDRRQRALVTVLRDEPVVGDAATALAVRDQLDRGFQRLSPEHRTVIVLRLYLGLSIEETADSLGIPVGTAKSRLHYATEAMRLALEADAGRTSGKVSA